MKNLIQCIFLAIIILMTNCASKKSKSTVKTTTTKSVQTTTIKKESKPKTVYSKTIKKESKTKTSLNTQKKQNDSIKINSKNTEIANESNLKLPSDAALKTFKATYPTINDALWARELIPNSKANNYKVYFIFNKVKNWELYSEEGYLIESRTEILEAQLPLNIHDAIKAKYPDVIIVSTSVCKKTNSNATYSAIIKQTNEGIEREIVLKRTNS